MKLGTRGRYAVMAMVDLSLHCEKNPVVLADIAHRQGLPPLYLEQIFIPLRQQSYVRSVRGQKGGYTLNQPSQSIKISDIVQAVGEPIKVTRCNGFSQPGCLSNQSKCLTHALWAGLENVLFEYLSQISLADVCRGRDFFKSMGGDDVPLP